MTSVNALEIRSDDLALVMAGIGAAAAAARTALALSAGSQRDAALLAAARSMRAHAPQILAANAQDMEAARVRGLSAALLDRLQLNEKRVRGDGRGRGADRGAGGSHRRHCRGMDAPERTRHPARAPCRWA